MPMEMVGVTYGVIFSKRLSIEISASILMGMV
jgi:hypothetical protein